MKNEREFVNLLGDIIIGSPCVLQLPNGQIVRTSAVQDYYSACSGQMIIKTINSIYRKY